VATKDVGTFEAEFLRLLPRIERNCRFTAGRLGLLDAEAEDFASHVKLRLIEDDYGILRKFQGRARIETFLATVIENLGRDYKIGLTSKWRPTAVARRLGPAAVLLERLIIRDRYTLDQAWEIMTTNHQLAVTRADVEQLAGQLPPRHVRQLISAEVLETVSATDPSPHDTVVEEEQRSEAARVRATLAELKDALPPQDQTILALRYEDGEKIVDIAAALGIEQRLLYRRIDGLHNRFRTELEARGISTDAIGWFEGHP
jgi:RNA polymerase sigma factor for flagellar operon FliA